MPLNNKRKASEAVRILLEMYPHAVCSLNYKGDPWRLLIMARLSAQCTDERVNLVCRELFRVYPNAEMMAAAEQTDIEALIKSCGLFRGKAKSIKEVSMIICEKHGGKVPDNMEELLELPGVGRKIANLLLGDIYGKGGIVADTHCIRICGRLGFYPEKDKNPLKTEKIMGELIEQREQSEFCHRIVLFGRDICRARAPECGICPMKKLCRYFEKTQKKESAGI